VLVSPPATGPENMALDHALLRRAAATGRAVLRVYSWITPTLSLGRHQPARGFYDLTAIRKARLDVVRRPTGGRAVLHHREVTYSVTAPILTTTSVNGRLRARDTYNAINRLLVGALRGLGVPAGLAPASGRRDEAPSQVARAPRPSENPCFDVATEGEVVVSGRKLVGSAQWRDQDAVLQHGSLLIADDQALLATLTCDPAAPVPVATLGQLLGRSPSVAEMAAVLRGTLDDQLRQAGAEPSADYPDDPATRGAAMEFRTQYADEGWTWRR
jgi:lipoyl(octanoyl) transferase